MEKLWICDVKDLEKKVPNVLDELKKQLDANNSDAGPQEIIIGETSHFLPVLSRFSLKEQLNRTTTNEQKDKLTSTSARVTEEKISLDLLETKYLKLYRVIANSPRLVSLRLFQVNIDREFFGYLRDAVLEIGSLERLYLQHVHLSGSCMKQMAEIIEGSNELKLVEIEDITTRDSKSGPEKFLKYIKEIRKAKSIEELVIKNIKHEHQGKTCENVLMDVLPQCASLKKLELSNRIRNKEEIGNCGVKGDILFTILKQVPFLVSLNLSYNKLSDVFNLDLLPSGTIQEEISAASLTSLELATLASCELDGRAAKYIALMLKKGLPLKELCISENKIGSYGADVILKVAAEQNSLVKLDLSGCSIYDEVSTESMKEFLTKSGEIKTLLLQNNKLGAATEAIAEALAKNKSLKVLNLGSNELTPKHLARLWEVLRTDNNSLEELHLHDNKIDDKSAQDISSMLKKNRSLIWLNLYRNNLASGIGEIMNSFYENSTLYTLDIGANGLKDPAPIIRTLEANKRLKVNCLDENTFEEDDIDTIQELMSGR